MTSSVEYLVSLDVTSSLLATASEKLFLRKPFITPNGTIDFQGSTSIYNLMQALIVDKSAPAIFLEFIKDKFGYFSVYVQEWCLKVQLFDDALLPLNSQPYTD